jgi:hypothetical protein
LATRASLLTQRAARAPHLHSNAQMKVMQREKAAFERAAAGDPAYRTQEFCLRMKGMSCTCTRCRQNTSMSLRPGSRLSTRPDDFVPSKELPALGQDFDRVPAYDDKGFPMHDPIHEEEETKKKSSRYESRIILSSTMR